MAENKVQFGLRNVYYAVLTATVGTGGTTTYSWATPVRIPGAVSLSLDAAGDITPFYADNVVFYKSVANSGYEGDLEIARVPDTMLTDVWGYTKGTTSKVIVENSMAEAKPFALLFEIDGDEDQQYYVLYNCSATRPAINGQTTTDTKEPLTQTCSITAAALEDGDVFARTSNDTPTATKTGWFSAVYRESP